MRAGDALGRHGPALRPGQRDRRRIELEGGEDVAVGRVAGRRDGDALAGIEQRQESEHEARRGSRRDHDPLRRDSDPIGVAIVAGDALTQRGEPERLRVADAPICERRPGRFARRTRRRGGGLPHLHMDDAVPSPFFRRGGGQHIHGQKRRHPPGAAGKTGDVQVRFGFHDPGVRARVVVSSRPATLNASGSVN
jgi:hypothetical protein